MKLYIFEESLALSQTSKRKNIETWTALDCAGIYRAQTREEVYYYCTQNTANSFSTYLRDLGQPCGVYFEFERYHLGIMLLEIGDRTTFKTLPYNEKRNEVYASFKLESAYFDRQHLRFVDALYLLEKRFLL